MQPGDWATGIIVSMKKRPAHIALFALTLCSLSACRSHSTNQSETVTPTQPPTIQPVVAAPVPLEHPGLHNVMAMSPKVYSGSMPEGDKGFDSLAALGIKTVISVDGARPDLERAAARGMNYIHIPIQYSGIKQDAAMQLTAAVRDLPGPIYLHCHHGKHRGPAAACLALVQTAVITPEQGVELLKIAGTSRNYNGLYEVVGNALPIEPASIEGLADTLPSTAPVPGFVAAMSGMEHVMEHLRAIEKAGWTAPPDHPDLVPASEAGMLHDYFRAAHDDSVDESDADDFAAWMKLSLDQSRSLESAIAAGDALGASAALHAVAQSCTDCHTRYRNPGK